MPIKYTLEEKGDFIQVTADDTTEDVQALLDYIDAVIAKSEELGIGRILMDHRKLIFSEDIALTYDLALQCVDRFSVDRPLKVSLVARPERMEAARIYESIGINRGVELKAFDRLKMAATWLKT